MTQLQAKYDTDIEELVKGYQVNGDIICHTLQQLIFDAIVQILVLSKYRPALHRWFLEQYPDPTEWVEARSMFTRSAAV